MRTEKKKTGFVIRALDTVERVGNSLPDPATIFFILTVAVILLSAVCAAFGVTVTYDYLDSASGQITPKTVAAVSLLAPDSIRHMVTTVVNNFTSFFALGTVFTIMIGVGVADGTGFMRPFAEGCGFYAKNVCNVSGCIFGNHVQYRLIHGLCGSGAFGSRSFHGLWTPSHCRAGGSLCGCIGRLERQSSYRHK